MSIGEASIRVPHNRLELEELFEEARLHVVDLFCVERYYVTHQRLHPLATIKAYTERARSSRYTTENSPMSDFCYTLPD